MANAVTGGQYLTIDARMSDIKRQLRNPKGSSIDIKMLVDVLQFFVEGRSMSEFLMAFPNAVYSPRYGFGLDATMEDTTKVFNPSVFDQPLAELGLPRRLLERLVSTQFFSPLRTISQLTDGAFTRDEIQGNYNLSDDEMIKIDERLAARGLRMKTEAELYPS